MADTRKAKATERPRPAAGDAAVPVQVVFGEDEYAVSSRAREIVEQLCPPDQQALGLEIIDGLVDTVADAIAALARCLEALRTVGFFGGRKVVWLRDANFLSDTPTGRSDDVKARLERLTAEIKRGLAPGQFLVVSAAKIDGRSSFYKTCKAAGSMTEFEKSEKAYLANEQARERAAEEFRKAGLRADPDLLECFVEKAGTDTRQIVTEVEKLSLYLGETRDVSEEDVDAIVSPAREAISWDFAEAVGKRDLPLALRLLRRLLAQKESPMRLIFAIERRFHEMLILRACMDRGWLRVVRGRYRPELEWQKSPDVDEMLGGLGKDDLRAQHPYRVGLLAQQAGAYKLEQLRRCRARILETHEKLVSSGVPQELLLEFLVLELAGRAPA